MHANSMPHGELDMATIEHSQQVVLCLNRRVRSTEFQNRVPSMDDSGAIDALGHQFRLKKPGTIPRTLWFLLVVHQEEGDAPVIFAFASQPLNEHFRAIVIDSKWFNRAMDQLQVFGRHHAGIASRPADDCRFSR